MNGYGLDVNDQVVRVNRLVAQCGGDYFIDILLMDEYLGEPDPYNGGFRQPLCRYCDVEGSEYLQIVRVDKDHNVLSVIEDYLSDNDAFSFLDGYETAIDGILGKQNNA